MLSRPLPPFRAKPSQKAGTPKHPSESRKDGDRISVKAHRRPIRVTRLPAAPTLKVLSRTEDNHA